MNMMFYGHNKTHYKPMIITYTVGSNDTVSIPMLSLGSYNFTVDWGDGSDLDKIISPTDINNTHTYTNAGSYNITILGLFEAFRFSDNSTADPMAVKLTAIVDWGYSALNYFAFAFARCPNLTSIPQKKIPCKLTTSFANGIFFQSGITSITADIFDNMLNAGTYDASFMDCLDIAGVAPDLWITNPTASHDFTFRNCNGLSNYNDIPIGWK